MTDTKVRLAIKITREREREREYLKNKKNIHLLGATHLLKSKLCYLNGTNSYSHKKLRSQENKYFLT